MTAQHTEAFPSVFYSDERGVQLCPGCSDEMHAVDIRSPPKLPGLLRAVQRHRWKNQTPFLEPELFPQLSPPLPYLYIFREESGAEFLHELQFLGGPHAQLGLLRLGPPSRPAASQIRGCRVDSSEAGEHGRMNGSTP